MATWNVQTMLQVGKLSEIADEFRKYKLHVLALQEIRWPGSGRIDKKDFTVMFSGAETGRQRGTGFMISKEVRKSLMEFTPVNERLCKIRLKGKFHNISIISTYAPTEDAEELDKDKFYDELDSLNENINGT